MTTKETIEQKYIPWLHANGITLAPTIEVFGDAAPSFEPPVEVVWGPGPTGSKLVQSAAIIASDIDNAGTAINGRMRNYYEEVRFATGGPERMVDYAEWSDPPKPPVDGIPAGLVGPEIPASIVGQFSSIDHTRKYYAVAGGNPASGSVYVAPDGKRYLTVNPGMFAFWFMAL